MKKLSTTQTLPQYLWFLTLTYCIILMLANWFDARLILIFGLNTDAGTIIFPITFVLCDIITEVYGYKNARFAIWLGFFFNLLFLVYGQIITHISPPAYATKNAMMFDKIFTTSARVVIGSFASYLFAVPVNSYIMAKLKLWLGDKLMWLRFVFSTFIASGLDSTIFVVIAFYGIYKNYNLAILAGTMWLIKVVIEVICLPISTTIAKKLKKVEQLDIYDFDTNFTLLSLNRSYTKNDNKFKRQL